MTCYNVYISKFVNLTVACKQLEGIFLFVSSGNNIEPSIQEKVEEILLYKWMNW